MSFIDKEDTLQVGIVVAVYLDLLLVLLELLDVDNHDFKFAIAILGNSRVADVIHQFVTAFGIADNKASGGKFIRSLFHQVNAINDEIEFRNGVLLSKVIREAFYRVESKGRLSATLGMPDDTAFYALVKRLAYGQ